MNGHLDQVVAGCNSLLLGVVRIRMGARPVEPIVDEFESFYRARYQATVRLAWLLTNDEPVSEDIAQDAFSRLQHRFGAVERPEAYLRMIVVHACQDRHKLARREAARIRLVHAAEPLHASPPGEPMVDALSRLPARQRAALVLRYWSDLPDKDIATALDVRPSTVRSLLARGLTALRKEFPHAD